MKHVNNGKCPKCAEFLATAHPDLRSWFEVEQAADPELHTCCSDRDKAAQEDALARKASKVHYGYSPHNYKPSWALDLFFIVNGTAAWVFSRYKKIAERLPDWMVWGADWNDNGRTDDEVFKDSPHFQFKGWEKLEKSYPLGTA